MLWSRAQEAGGCPGAAQVGRASSELASGQRPSARASGGCGPCPSLSRAGPGTAAGAAGWHGTARLTSTRAVQSCALQAVQRAGEVMCVGWATPRALNLRGRCVRGWGRFVAGKGGSVPQQRVREVGSVTGTCALASTVDLLEEAGGEVSRDGSCRDAIWLETEISGSSREL